MSTGRSTCIPGPTVPLSGPAEAADMRAPPKKTSAYSCVQVHVPAFSSLQILTKAAPGAISLKSRMVASLTKLAGSVQIEGEAGGVAGAAGAGWGTAGRRSVGRAAGG